MKRLAPLGMIFALLAMASHATAGAKRDLTLSEIRFAMG